MKGYLSSWSLRIGLVLLVPLLLFMPWRQEFLWRLGDGTLAPVRATRYRFFWDAPWNASFDVGRLAWEVLLLVIVVMVAYRFEESRRSGRPQRVMRAGPAPGIERYAEAEWQSEVSALEAGTPPNRCPSCGRTGFYGPRHEGTRHFRLCKFCGFHQAVGKRPFFLRPCVHNCGRVPQVAGAPMISWVPSGATTYGCPGCGQEAAVASSVISSPTQEPTHPWWKVPQNLSRQEYIRFWLASGAPGASYL